MALRYTQTASEAKTSHTGTAKKPDAPPAFNIRSHFTDVIRLHLLLSVWSGTPPPSSCFTCGDIGRGVGVGGVAFTSPLPPFSRPFCSASILLQTNSGNFLLYCRFLKRNFFLFTVHTRPPGRARKCVCVCACLHKRVSKSERKGGNSEGEKKKLHLLPFSPGTF